MLRRKFVQRMAGALSAAAFWKIGVTPSTFALTSRQTFAGYPRPSYLPKNFVEVNAISGLRRSVDGFGDEQSEIALWYRNDKHPLGFNNPLAIYITPNPRRAFSGTQGLESRIVQISLKSGNTVSAEYHDGMRWLFPKGELGWNRTNVHSLVFYNNNLAFGIRGARSVGVNYRELIEIASSF